MLVWLDAIPPLTLLIAAGSLTLAQYRVAPLTWRLSNGIARYGVLALAIVLALAYTAILAPGPISAIVAVSDSFRTLISVGLLGLALGFFIIASMLLRRGRDDGEL